MAISPSSGVVKNLSPFQNVAEMCLYYKNFNIVGDNDNLKWVEKQRNIPSCFNIESGVFKSFNKNYVNHVGVQPRELLKLDNQMFHKVKGPMEYNDLSHLFSKNPNQNYINSLLKNPDVFKMRFNKSKFGRIFE